MAKKTLNEAVVRRFQKLANVAPINEMYSKYEEGYMQEEEEAAEAPAGEEKMDAPEADMGADMGGEEDAMVELTMDKIETLEQARDIIDDIVSSAGDAGEGEEDMGMDMDNMDMDNMDDKEELEEEAADAIMEALSGISYQPSQSEIVNEVAQRVAKRLQAAKLHEAKLNKALGRK